MTHPADQLLKHVCCGSCVLADDNNNDDNDDNGNIDDNDSIDVNDYSGNLTVSSS